jgi:hypothetical protein
MIKEASLSLILLIESDDLFGLLVSITILTPIKGRSTVGRKTNILWLNRGGETHPTSHGDNDIEVSMNSGIGSLDPSTARVGDSVAAHSAIASLGVWYSSTTLETSGVGAVVAVTLSIWESISIVTLHEGVGAENESNLPVSIGSIEQLDTEASM